MYDFDQDSINFNDTVIQYSGQREASKTPNRILAFLGACSTLIIGFIPIQQNNFLRQYNMINNAGHNYFIQDTLSNCKVKEGTIMQDTFTSKVLRFRSMHKGVVEHIGRLPIETINNSDSGGSKALRFKGDVTVRVKKCGRLPIPPVL